MLLLSTITISFFYILYIVKNIWDKIYVLTPSWGDSKLLIYLLLIFYTGLNLYNYIILNSKFNKLYIYIFTVLSIGYIYTLYNIKLDETFIFVILLACYQIYLFILFKNIRKFNILLLTIILYISAWTYKIKDNK